MEGLRLPAFIESALTWRYADSVPRVRALYEKAKAGQWNATTDVDWSAEVGFGGPLPDGSAADRAAFAASPLAGRGRPAWDGFRWEFQSFMVSQFLHGEQGALVAAARLAEELPQLDLKLCAAGQVVDEARHVEAFARYLAEHVPEPYGVTDPLAALLADILTDRRWDVTALGMQLMVEPLAMAAFRIAHTTFCDPLIKQIAALVARDEARHVSFGVLSLTGLYDTMTAAERAEREQFVLEAARNLRRRFMLEDVWERLDVSRAEGREYAERDSLMSDYRKAVFAKVVAALAQVGLFTPTVLHGFEQLGLVRYVPGRRRLGELALAGAQEAAR